MPSFWDRIKQAFGGKSSKGDYDFDEDLNFINEEDRDATLYSELGDENDQLVDFMEEFVPDDPDAELDDETKEANRSLGRQLYDRAANIAENFKYKDRDSTMQSLGLKVTGHNLTDKWKGSGDGIKTSVNFMQMASCEIAKEIIENDAMHTEKEQADILKKASFRFNMDDFEKGFYKGADSKVRDLCDENEIHAYMENMRAFCEGGKIEKSLADLAVDRKLEPEAYPIRDQLTEMRKNFRYNIKNNPAGLTKNGVLPMFRKEDLEEMNKLCNDYFKENGYKNTPSNKAIRDIKKSVDRARLFRYNHPAKRSLAETNGKNQMMQENLASIGERLKEVSDGSKSKQFRALQDALTALNEKDVSKWSKEEREHLRDVARDYIDAKKSGFLSGGSTRRTDKGQIRFDIAGEILNLCEGDLMKPSESKAERKARMVKEGVIKQSSYKDIVAQHNKEKEIFTEADKKREREKLAAYVYKQQAMSEEALKQRGRGMGE